MSICSRLLSVQ